MKLVTGGSVVTPGGVVTADIVIAGEAIAGVVAPGSVEGGGLDARGCYVLPGGVDPHAHLLSDVPAADAGALGGTTTVLSFTWPEPEESPIAAFERARDLLLPATSLDVGLHAALWSPDDTTADDVVRLAELGACGLKLYVAYPELGIMASDRRVFEIMKYAAAVDLPVQVHCENGHLIAALTAEALAAGQTDIRSFYETRPAIAEEESVHRVLRLAEAARCRLYLVHLSTARALEHVRAARRRGLPVCAEACTCWMTLDDSVVDAPDPQRFLACPPPRPRADVEAIWDGVRDGTVDTLGSDHHQDPYVPPAADDFTGLPYGIRGLRPRLPVLLAEGLQRGIAIDRMMDLLARRPSRAFGVRSKGAIVPGADADLALWDPAGSWTIEDEYPAWAGHEVQGHIRTVLRRGELLVTDGELAPDRTAGRHVAREARGWAL